MKKALMIFLMIIPGISIAEMQQDMQLQMLDSELEILTKERDKKYEELKQCEKQTKGFKIAGITTLVATGFGVYGNIKLSQKLNNKGSGGGAGNARVVDNRSQEEKDEDSCGVLCDAGIGESAGCSC